MSDIPPPLLVTGANGFVGQALCKLAQARGADLHTATRTPHAELPGRNFTTGDMSSSTNWQAALASRKVVVHLAARVHVMQEQAVNPLAEFRNANVATTLHLARAAASAGVSRFIYLSSIKVNGEATLPGHPFRESDTPAPQDAYAVSKWEAEQGLTAIARETGMEVVILRPPLMYGPGVKGNFERLARIASLPLPLASINNRRDLLHVDNMADAILLCARHPAAANQTFLVCDGKAVSTPELIRHLAEQNGQHSRLWPFPPMLLQLAARLIGKQAVMDRLAGSLELDCSKIRQMLGWQSTAHDHASRLPGRISNRP